MNVLTIVIVTLTTVLVIAFSRKIEKPTLPGILILVYLFLLIYHSYILKNVSVDLEEVISQIYLFIAMDFLWLLMSFLGYLWIDDISATKLHKKSYDDSLKWFWDKI
jgi:Na+/citrate or Na+/malate symporter